MVVYCEDGIVRSPTVVLLVLMHCTGCDFGTAHRWLLQVDRRAAVLHALSRRTAGRMLPVVRDDV